MYHSIRMNGLNGHASLREPSANGGDARHFIELLRTLADPIRLRMVRLLESRSAADAAGLSVGELGEIMKLPQSTVSRHLKTLTDAHFAEPRREGTSTFYRLSDAAGKNASRQLRQIASTHLDEDATAKNDAHRLAAVLRNRESVEESFFGKHAPQWDELRAQWFGDRFHLEALLALLNPNWTVADIGTGTGIMLPLLAPHVKQVIAIDPSAAMLKGARRRVKELNLTNVDIRQGAAENLPMEKESADVVLLALVLAYTAQPEAVLREARRVLKPGGALLVIDLQPHEVAMFRDNLNHRWMGFSEAQLRNWLNAAAFSDIRWHPLSPQKSRENETPVPDLFVLRAEAA